MDVFVHASVVPEPFGQVILEAMAAGVPVAAAAGGGASEIAADDHTALLHPPVTPAHWPTGWSGWRPTRSPAASTAAGRRRARDFGPEAVADRLGKLYDALQRQDGD